MITPTVDAILFFASTLLPEHLCIKKFSFRRSLDIFLTHLLNFLELLLSILNYGIIFAHNANVKRCRCSLKCGNQSQASH